MADSGEHGAHVVVRPAATVAKVDSWVQWMREAVTIISAAGAAYMGIRVDLARNQMDIENIKAQQARIEFQIEKMRDASMAAREGAHK